MASTYSTSLKLTLIGDGDQTGTWGQTTNTNLGTLLEQAIVGQTTITMANADYTLTNLNGATDEARGAVLILTGNQNATYSVIVPAVPKLYMVTNSLGSSAIAYIKPSGGNTFQVPNGRTMYLYTNGTTFYALDYVTYAQTLVTGGTITTGAISCTSLTSSGAVSGTTITASTQFSGPGTGITGLPLTTGVTGTLPVTNGGTGVVTSTGSGSVVLSTSPTLVTPLLGTPTSGNLANCTFPTLNQNTTGNAATATTATNLSGGTVSATTISGTTITASTQFTGPGTGLTGTAASLTVGNATTAATVSTTVASAAIGTTQAPGTNNTTIATTAFVAAAMAVLYPVGSIYSSTVSTNPNTLFGFGTWVAFGAGRVMIGDGGGYAAGATGGSADAVVVTHNHSATSTVTDPGHNHLIESSNDGLVGGTNSLGPGSGTNFLTTSATDTRTTGVSVATSTSNTGVSPTNANLQPYIVVYMWNRTA